MLCSAGRCGRRRTGRRVARYRRLLLCYYEQVATTLQRCNHEFDYGMNRFRAAGYGDFPYVSANFVDLTSGALCWNRTQFSFNGVKVAFVKRSTPFTVLSTPAYFQTRTETSSTASARRAGRKRFTRSFRLRSTARLPKARFTLSH